MIYILYFYAKQIGRFAVSLTVKVEHINKLYTPL